MNIRLLSYNLRFGGKGRESLLLDVLQSVQPDIALLQEATDPEFIARLAADLSMPFWTAGKKRSLAFISRFKIAQWQWKNAPPVKNAFLDLTIEDPRLRLIGVHLRPWFSKWAERMRKREIQFMLQNLQTEASANRSPHVLLGDFNTLAPGDGVRIDKMPAWIRALIFIGGGRIETSAIAHLLQSGYVDGFRRLHPDQNGFTFPSFSPHIRLDYIFLPSGIIDCLTECRVIDTSSSAAMASDHFPLLAVLRL